MAIFEQDFLMRQIQYMTQLLQEILFKKSQNQYEEAVEEIQDAYKRLTVDQPKEFHELSLEETIAVFVVNKRFHSELALAVADLLVEEGEMLDNKSYSRAQKSYSQAMLLYKKCLRDKNAAIPLDINKTMEFLKNQLHHEKIKEVNKTLD